jgi:hypothetical protein
MIEPSKNSHNKMESFPYFFAAFLESFALRLEQEGQEKL